MDFNGSLCILIRPYSFLWIVMGPYAWSLQVLIRPHGYLLVLIVPFTTAWSVMGPEGSL